MTTIPYILSNDNYSLYILSKLMGFVQDKVMKCPYHGDEL